MQVIVRGRSSYPSWNCPSRTTGHNPTQRHRLAWGKELDYHNPVGREVPGRVGRYRHQSQRQEDVEQRRVGSQGVRPIEREV